MLSEDYGSGLATYFVNAFEDQRYANGGIGFSIPELLSKPLGGFGLLLGVVFCLILAGFIAALFAFLIGLPVLKLKSDYLAIPRQKAR